MGPSFFGRPQTWRVVCLLFSASSTNFGMVVLSLIVFKPLLANITTCRCSLLGLGSDKRVVALWLYSSFSASLTLPIEPLFPAHRVAKWSSAVDVGLYLWFDPHLMILSSECSYVLWRCHCRLFRNCHGDLMRKQISEYPRERSKKGHLFPLHMVPLYHHTLCPPVYLSTCHV